MSAAGPIRTACPTCGHPLVVEIWTRADTVSGRMVDEVVIISPMARGPIKSCPGCGGPVEALGERYRTA
jgi:endogenous inhibitor of DNA gyrase (YacG/DUF329 family)